MTGKRTLDDLLIRGSSHTPFFGIYLASHAISDSLCMCHASVGCKVKTELHLCDHDGVADAHNRRRYSQFIDEDLISGSTAQLEEEVRAWQRRQKSALVLLDGSTPISLQGQSMRPVIARLEAETGAHVVHVPSRNYGQDLWQGYGATIEALLQRQQWPAAADQGAVARDEVSVIGYPFDRYEPDNHGNVAELRRLLWGLGLKARSVLFAGEDYATLQLVTRARSHLLLPWAHGAAGVLGRLGRDHLQTGVPMSIAGTSRWLRDIGAHLGLDRGRVEAFIGRETDAVKPLYELARRRLSGRHFAVFAEAPRAAGLMATLMEVGMVPVVVGALHFSLGGQDAVRDQLAHDADLTVPGHTRWLADPSPLELRAMAQQARDVLQSGRLQTGAGSEERARDAAGPPDRTALEHADVILGPTVERGLLSAAEIPWIEQGFPSENRHFLFPAPWLGYRGGLRLLEQVMAALERG